MLPMQCHHPVTAAPYATSATIQPQTHLPTWHYHQTQQLCSLPLQQPCRSKQHKTPGTTATEHTAFLPQQLWSPTHHSQYYHHHTAALPLPLHCCHCPGTAAPRATVRQRQTLLPLPPRALAQHNTPIAILPPLPLPQQRSTPLPCTAFICLQASPLQYPRQMRKPGWTQGS